MMSIQVVPGAEDKVNVFSVLKNTLKIEEVAENLLKLPLKNCGGEWLEYEDAECPLCGRYDAFRINHVTQSWHCFSCCEGGDVTALVAKVKGLKMRKAADLLQRMVETGELEPSEGHGGGAESAQARQDALVVKLENATADATWMWCNSQAVDSHPYLDRKKVGAHGIRVNEGKLLVPVRDGKTLTGLQEIKADGTKTFRKGSSAAGNYHAINAGTQRVYIAEGYATAASIHEATGCSAIVAFNAGNLKPVAVKAKERLRADVDIVICADNDTGKDGNPGLEFGEAAARAIGAKMVYPVFPEGVEGNDFNDLCQHFGPEHVKEAIESQLMVQAPMVKDPGGEPGAGAMEVAGANGGGFRSTGPSDDLVSNLWAEVQRASDLRNAEDLIALLRDRTRYVHEQKGWAWCHDDSHWEFGRTDMVEHAAKPLGEAWREMAELAEGVKELPSALISVAKRCESLAGIRAAMGMACSSPDVRESLLSFDANTKLLGVRNGVVDLETFAFRPLVPGDLVSKRCQTIYDAEQGIGEWLRFLEQVTDHLDPVEAQAFITYLQKVCGACLLGRTGRRPFFFVYGPPASGKSVFTNLLRYILGDYAQALSNKALMQASVKDNDIRNPELASLPGVRACIVPETGDENCFNDELIKSMTGGDPIKARGNYQDPIEFIFQGVLVFIGNSFPSSSTGGPAFMDRIRIIGFPNSVAPEKRDDTLPDKLKAEAPGILRWMIEGAHKLVLESWRDPECVVRETAKYRGSMDTLGLFLDECCDRRPELSASKKELYGAYSDWAKENGFSPLGSSRFGQRLNALGIGEGQRRNNIRQFASVAMKVSICDTGRTTGGVDPLASKYQIS
jgi:P4 family phage/plasmid primase-like protien